MRERTMALLFFPLRTELVPPSVCTGVCKKVGVRLREKFSPFTTIYSHARLVLNKTVTFSAQRCRYKQTNWAQMITITISLGYVQVKEYSWTNHPRCFLLSSPAELMDVAAHAVLDRLLQEERAARPAREDTRMIRKARGDKTYAAAGQQQRRKRKMG